MFALIRQESVFDAEATSWAGAVGLTQVMPSTGEWIAEMIGLARLQPSRLAASLSERQVWRVVPGPHPRPGGRKRHDRAGRDTTEDQHAPKVGWNKPAETRTYLSR